MRLSLMCLSALAFCLTALPAAAQGKRTSSFGKYPAPGAAEVKKQADAWVKATSSKIDEKQLKAVWSGDRALLEKVAKTLALGDADAAKLLREASEGAAPTEVPAVLKDEKKPAFYRNNLALAYARALAMRQVYEEALEVFSLIKADDVVDPATYFFYRGVCEFGLMLKGAAQASIDKLIADTSDAPQGYLNVAALMNYEMDVWQEKDLDWVARKMENVQRRLGLGRGGKKTRRMQREVLARLEEMIKEMEPREPRNPDGPPRPGGEVRAPKEVFRPGPMKTPGDVDRKPDQLAEWIIKLPEKERAKVRAELLKHVPAGDRAIIERYFRELEKQSRK